MNTNPAHPRTREIRCTAPRQGGAWFASRRHCDALVGHAASDEVVAMPAGATAVGPIDLPGVRSLRCPACGAWYYALAMAAPPP